MTFCFKIKSPYTLLLVSQDKQHAYYIKSEAITLNQIIASLFSTNKY